MPYYFIFDINVPCQYRKEIYSIFFNKNKPTSIVAKKNKVKKSYFDLKTKPLN